MAGPVAQAVPPRGNQMQVRQMGGVILMGLNKMLGSLNPGDEEYKSVARAIDLLSKHYAMASGGAGGGAPQPTMAPRPPGQPPMQTPMMSGGPQAGAAQRGPAAMPA